MHVMKPNLLAKSFPIILTEHISLDPAGKLMPPSGQPALFNAELSIQKDKYK
jgi:hypothetical protein